MCEIIVRPAVSLCPKELSVNEIETDLPFPRLFARLQGFILAKKLFAVLNKTDQHDHRGTNQADKKHHFEQSHGKNGNGHTQIVAGFGSCKSGISQFVRQPG
jgi:hypothetical protein